MNSTNIDSEMRQQVKAIDAVIHKMLELAIETGIRILSLKDPMEPKCSIYQLQKLGCCTLSPVVS